MIAPIPRQGDASGKTPTPTRPRRRAFSGIESHAPTALRSTPSASLKRAPVALTPCSTAYKSFTTNSARRSIIMETVQLGNALGAERRRHHTESLRCGDRRDRSIWHQHHVIVFRGVDWTPDAQLALRAGSAISTIMPRLRTIAGRLSGAPGSLDHPGKRQAVADPHRRAGLAFGLCLYQPTGCCLDPLLHREAGGRRRHHVLQHGARL